MSPPFLDTVVLVYAALQPDPRSDAARALLRGGRVVSVQVLNEFANVARRKLRRSWPEVQRALAAVRALCPAPRPITAATHEAALALAERTGCSAGTDGYGPIWDAFTCWSTRCNRLAWLTTVGLGRPELPDVWRTASKDAAWTGGAFRTAG